MIALLVIMVQELANAVPQRIFSEEDHLIQAAFLNSPHAHFLNDFNRFEFVHGTGSEPLLPTVKLSYSFLKPYPFKHNS